MVQKYKKNTKYFFESKKSCTFAPAFRRNRWHTDELFGHVAQGTITI